MATSLSLSISYLSQIESGDRPLTGAVLGALASRYPSDWAVVEPDDESAFLVGVLDASIDASVPDVVSDRRDVERAIRQHPLIARRLLAVHRSYQRSLEQLRILDESVDANTGGSRLPWEEVRDWFHLQQNYVDELDREAERIATELIGSKPHAGIEDRLARRFGISIETVAGDRPPLREYDHDGRVLRVDAAQPPETTSFSLAYQLARLEFGDMIRAWALQAMATEDGRQLLAAGLTNYAAGALLMPYTRFREEARQSRHDVDRLRQRFGTSFEQTCHRLSTLQRPGLLGVPVFFCRVDMAGNITKRHSATRLQFARFGGACPLWIVHEAVAIPDRILVQLAETPDGVRYGTVRISVCGRA